ncbi:hypothetical protein LTR55_012205, partial [Exophiala xenobiotica]
KLGKLVEGLAQCLLCDSEKIRLARGSKLEHLAICRPLEGRPAIPPAMLQAGVAEKTKRRMANARNMRAKRARVAESNPSSPKTDATV